MTASSSSTPVRLIRTGRVRARRLSGALLCALLCSSPARAEEAPRRSLTLIMSSGIDGSLATPNCDGGKPVGRTLAHLASSVDLARRQATADGRTVVASIHLGDLTGPGALSRFLVSRPGGAERLGNILGASHFEYAILGKHWFDVPAPALAVLGRMLPDHGVSLLSANVSCEGRPDCDTLNDMPNRTDIDVNGLIVSIIGLTDDDSSKSIDPTVVKGLTVQSEAAALVDESEAARKAGAQLIIGAVSMNGAHATAAEIESDLRQASQTDLMIANQLRDFTAATSVISPTHGAPVVVAGRSSTEVVRLDFDAVAVGGRWQVQNLRAQRVAASQPDETLTRELQAVHQDYCAEWDKPLAVRAEPAVERLVFLQSALETIRERSFAEVAIINDGMVARDVFPWRGDISIADIFTTIRYDDTLMRAHVKGSWISALWAANAARSGDGAHFGLDWVGVESRGDNLWVNGRRLVDEESYTVVVPDFLARGAEDWITDNTAFDPVAAKGHILTVRELLQDSYSTPPRGTQFASLKHPDLSRQFRWTWVAALTLNLNDLSIQNYDAYHDARLLGEPSLTVGSEFFGQAAANQENHGIRFTMRAAWYGTWQSPAYELETITNDLFGEALYKYQKIQRLMNDAWYAPIPYVSGQVDTEFQPTPGESYRHLELGAAVGARIMPWGPLELKVGFGVRREVLDPTGYVIPGIVVGYDLPHFNPFRIAGTPVDLESSLDFFSSGRSYQEGRLRIRFSFPLAGPIEMTTGLDMFLYQAMLGEKLGPVALSTQAVLGITGHLDGSRQQF